MNSFSSEGAVDQLNIFSLPSTQAGVEKIFYEDVYPINQNYDSVIEFKFPQNEIHYVYPKGFRMSLTFRVLRPDGTECLPVDKYVPIDLLLHTLWSDVVVKLNSKQISNSTGNYAYKSYFETTLNRSTQGQKIRLAPEFHSPDRVKFNEVPPTKEGDTMQNSGAFFRSGLSEESNQVTVYGPILEEFFSLDKFIPPNQELAVTFFRNSDAFCLITGEKNIKSKLTMYA